MIFLLLSLCVLCTEISLTTEELIRKGGKPVCTYPGEEYQTCGVTCEATCASIHSHIIKDCNKDCIPGCFCRKGFVREDNQDITVRPKCIKATECPKRECPVDACVMWDKKENLWIPCQEAEPCNDIYNSNLPSETILYHLVDLDDVDADAIKDTMFHVEAATCLKWRELPRCCIANKPNNGRPLYNYVNISDSRWCWFQAQRSEEDCFEVDSHVTPAQWTEGQIFYLLQLSLGLQNETEREDSDQHVTMNLNIKVNGQKQLSARLKPPYHYDYKLFKNPLIYFSVTENSSLLNENKGQELKSADFSVLNLIKINELFNCPIKEAVW